MNLQQIALETIETNIIAKMAKEAGVQEFQMVSMINRIPELKDFYKKLRSDVIKGMAA